MVDMLGFAASGLIIASLAMRSMGWLRLVGLTGALTFIMYGLSLEAWPVVATNTATATLHTYHLCFGGRSASSTGTKLEQATQAAAPSE